jgi:hypothetical protein
MKFHTGEQLALQRHHARIYSCRRNSVWDLRSPEVLCKQLFTPGNKLALLGALEKLRKATISFVVSVRRSVRSVNKQIGSQWTDFHEF